MALVSLGVIAASILRGMHLRLGLWPEGPWRDRFSTLTLVLVGIAFAIAFALTGPAPPDIARQVDAGTYVTVAVGVVAFGAAWAVVRQRPFVPWFAIALGAGLLPPLAVVLAAAAGIHGEPMCLVVPMVGGSACRASLVHAFGFLTALGAAVGLVTTELAFRRLLVGRPAVAGLVVVILAAGAQAAWTALVGVRIGSVPMPWWLAGASAIAAGGVYVLSGALLTSALLSASVAAGYAGVVLADPAPTQAAGAVFAIALGVVSVALAAAVWRRRGLLTGLR